MKQTKCPGCGVTMHYLSQHEGQTFKCPKCPALISIPLPLPPAPPVAVPPAVAARATQASPAPEPKPIPFRPEPADSPFSSSGSPFPPNDSPFSPSYDSPFSSANSDDYDDPSDAASSPALRTRRPPAAARERSAGDVLDFLDLRFESFITPTLIRIAWLIAIIFAGGLTALALIGSLIPTRYNYADGYPTLVAFGAITTIVVLNLVVYRILCEVAIVFFDMRDTLRRMEKHLAEPSTRRDAA